ncbi:CBO0543 family protein [Neobacillus sp. PS3-40]|uniref:CBO0543 family protein n=1 Tax=Neobacillus sp. PS3-40 TaxID=3070679 RepID=UPI0027E1A993|nr:CBO0543 family protein [Neobacillus sp. PS3-40]WML44242.1 CBO0543 family protein [Neobacillus sp. PS3-40]
MLVILSIVPAIIWWIFADKRRIMEITTFGLFYGVTSIILDSIGSNAMVWTYQIRLTPYLEPQMYPYDVGIVIILFMVVYQRYGKDFKTFIFYSCLLSLFQAFLAEPAMERLDIYKEISWKHIYSFPVYWIIGITCWSIVKYFKSLEQRV